MMKLVILDRDGVINYDSVNFIRSPDEWHAIPGSLQAIAELNKHGYKVAIATNQSGLARGYFSEDTLQAIHEKMQYELALVGGKIDSIFYCPHLPEDNCDCRKPKPGLLLKIAEHYNCTLENVPMMGDNIKDLQAARNAGAIPIYINTNKTALPQDLANVRIYADLASAVDAFLR